VQQIYFISSFKLTLFFDKNRKCPFLVWKPVKIHFFLKKPQVYLLKIGVLGVIIEVI
jgi:hypothetical protein